MNLRELIEAVNGRILSDNVDLEQEIKGACGADLMSDVLATVQPNAVLVTGLCNPQVVRTAQMADILAIVFIRGKNPPDETISLANNEGIPLISTPLGMFELCGRLYQAGVPSLEKTIAGGPCDCG